MSAAAPSEDRDHLPFAQHHAFIIGIDAYQKVSRLKTAVSDARKLAEVLGAQQHFLIHPPLLDATGDAIRTLLQTTLREQVKKDDRVFFYFAGHGIAADGDDGPAGYIVPADADPADVKTFIPMADLQRALDALPCRHLLLVLDCCFSGAFKWSSQYRAIGTLMPKKIYRERFDRFIQDPAWQVITSAAYDQKALDVLDGKATGDRGITQAEDNSPHSPFARALFEALAGAADVKGERESDGIITATELYCYIRDQIEPETIEANQRLRQTPGFFPLRKHDKGEFIFLHPRHRLNLPPTPKRSPYKGLASFEEDDRLLFYGRDRVIKELREKAEGNKLLVVSGASGTGKSSVIKAGLLPVLREEGCHILPVIRPGEHPLDALDEALKQAQASPSDSSDAQTVTARKAILLIDQFEEVITRCADEDERRQFDAKLRQLLDDDQNIHRVILTVRSDFEPQLNGGALKEYWTAGRCTVPPFSLEELKEVVVMPTIQEVLIFDPPQLVEEIIAEVVQSPGALPLLSYALSELYEAYRTSGRQDRALKKEDYDKLGGVMGALRTKADTLYQGLPADEQSTMRKVMLRMVSVEGDLASRRVPTDDLNYSDQEEPLVKRVVEKLVDARLIVKGQNYIEPAHDALVRAWKTLHEWIHEAGKEKLILGAKLSAEAIEYFAQSQNEQYLWNDNPHLAILEAELINPRRWLNTREITFVERSVARKKKLLQEREEQLQKIAEQQAARAKLQRRATWGLVGAAVILLGLVAWVVKQTRNLNIDKSFILAGAAESASDGKQYDRGLRLSILAARTSWFHPAHPTAAPALARAADGCVLRSLLIGHSATVRTANFSPDGKRVVTASDDKTARVWDAETGRPLSIVMKHDAEVYSASYSPDGKRVVTASGDKTARMWDADTGKPVGEMISHTDEIYSASFSPDGRRVVTASRDKTACVWDAETGKPVGAAMKHDAAVNSASFSPDGKRVVTASDDKTARVWDAETGRPVGGAMTHDERVYSAGFSPDGRRVVTASVDKTARMWEAKTSSLMGEALRNDATVNSVSFSPDGKRVVTASADNKARIWNAETHEPIGIAVMHDAAVNFASFSPDGKHVVTASDDFTARVWDIEIGEFVGGAMTHDATVNSANFSPDGKRLVTASADKTARVWDAETGKPMSSAMRHDAAVNSASFSPDGKRVVTASDDKTARVWDAESGRPLSIVMRHDAEVYSASYSPDGKRVVTASGDKTARLWDADTGKPNGNVMRHNTYVYSASFSPDGRRVVTASDDAKTRVWDTETGKPVGEAMTHNTYVNSASFGTDAKRIVTASADKTARVWDAETGRPVSGAMTHGAAVIFAGFSPDGKRVVTASEDKTARVWDVETGKPVGEAKVHSDRVITARFNSDGKRLTTVSAGKTAHVLVWNIFWPTITNTETLIREVCERKLRGEARRLTQADDPTGRILTTEQIGQDVCKDVLPAGTP